MVKVKHLSLQERPERKHPMAPKKPDLPDDTTIELVRSLFTTLLPTTIMAVSFAAIGILVATRSQSYALDALVLLGCIASLVRVAVLVLHRKQATDAFPDLQSARRLEQRFAVAYVIFAVIFGLFSATAFAVTSDDARIVIIGLLVGYGVGVAAGLSLRLRDVEMPVARLTLPSTK
jgi:hypothetical protein